MSKHMVQANMDQTGWIDVQDYRSRANAEATAEKLRERYGDRVECRVVEVGWTAAS